MTEKKSGENDQVDVRIVEISKEPVELYKILKFEGVVTSGGQAKAVIAEGQVMVNNKTETQKRKKIVTGDTIEFNREKIRVQFVATTADPTVTLEVEKNEGE